MSMMMMVMMGSLTIGSGCDGCSSVEKSESGRGGRCRVGRVGGGCGVDQRALASQQCPLIRALIQLVEHLSHTLTKRTKEKGKTYMYIYIYIYINK